MLTIVMYHYVRDLPKTEHPRIKGLLTEHFDGQLDYLQEHYRLIDAAEVVRAVTQGGALPPDACLLTFDDGFSDHYETVFPRLRARGITGAFFPAASSSLDHELLDVHKIHFVLASVAAAGEIQEALLRELDDVDDQYSLAAKEELLAKHAERSRYDEPAVTFVKRMLQTVLPQDVRSEIASRLFRRFVDEDETAFARRLYMTVPQMREMLSAGMTIGGHGSVHNRLGKLPVGEQEQELSATLSFLEHVHSRRPTDWIMCYPYGSYNDASIEILRGMGAAAAVTTRVGLVTDLSHPFELERLDTNDLPWTSDAPTSEWTTQSHAASDRMRAPG